MTALEFEILFAFDFGRVSTKFMHSYFHWTAKLVETIYVLIFIYLLVINFTKSLNVGIK